MSDTGKFLAGVSRKTAQAYLSQAGRIDQAISTQMQELTAVRKQRDKVQHQLSLVKTGSGESTIHLTLLANLTRRQEELEGEILTEYAHLIEKQKEIKKAIRQVPNDTQRMVLEKRYLVGLPFFCIAQEMNYSERQVLRLHTDGLEHVALQLIKGLLSQEKLM